MTKGSLISLLRREPQSLGCGDPNFLTPLQAPFSLASVVPSFPVYKLGIIVTVWILVLSVMEG